MNLVELETCGVCFGWSRTRWFLLFFIEKSNIREDGFFIPIPLFFLWLTCSIASAEIFISIYRESFGLTSKSQLDFEIFIFVPLFLCHDGILKKKRWRWILKIDHNFLTKSKTFPLQHTRQKSLKNLITQIALPNPQFTEYQTEFTNCVSVPIFKCNCEKSRFTPPPTFQFYL